jgi:effector-binding domain-containing protein
MILHMGVRTTSLIRVARKSLRPEEEEATAICELLYAVNRECEFGGEVYDHSMVVHYFDQDESTSRREVLVPVRGDVEGVETSTLPSMRVAFLVFKGADATVEERYEQLQDYIKVADLEPEGCIRSIEVMYVPESVDEQDYTMEIMVPVTN